jgi:hypothetical protein
MCMTKNIPIPKRGKKLANPISRIPVSFIPSALAIEIGG